MLELNFDRVLTIASLLLGYYWYRRSLQRKILAISMNEPGRLAFLPGRSDCLELRYSGETVSEVFRTHILFHNRGTVPFEAADLLEPVTISFPDQSVLAAEISDRDLTTSVTLSLVGDRILLDVGLMRAGEAFLAFVDTRSNSKPTLKVETKSFKVATSSSGFLSFGAEIAAFSCAYLVLMTLLFQDVVAIAIPFVLRLNLPEWVEGPAFVATTLLPIFTLSVVIYFLVKSVFQRLTIDRSATVNRYRRVVRSGLIQARYWKGLRKSNEQD